MNENGTVNGQIIDSVTGVSTLLAGSAASQAFGMLDAVLLESLGMAMHNAVSRQQGASIVSSASVAAACAKMLGAPFPIKPPPPAPAPPPPAVSIGQLPGPPHSPPPASALVAPALAEGEDAIDVLNTQAHSAGTTGTAAQANLQKLATDANTAATSITTDSGSGGDGDGGNNDGAA